MSKFVGNPTDQDLFCAVAASVIPARGELEVPDEVAALVPDHVFTVSDQSSVAALAADSAEAETPAEEQEAEEAELAAAVQKIDEEAAQPAEGASE